MSDAAEMQRLYVDALDLHDLVTVRRYVAAGPELIPLDAADCRARVMDYAPAELVNGIIKGDRRVILLAADLAARQWAGGVPAKDDKIVLGGSETNIEAVDDRTRRYRGVLLAYEIRIRG